MSAPSEELLSVSEPTPEAQPTTEQPVAKASKALAGTDPTLEAALAGDDFEASLKEPSEGDVISGVIVHIDKEGILVDVGAKSEGLVRPNEISRAGMEFEEELAVGDPVRVVVIG